MRLLKPLFAVAAIVFLCAASGAQAKVDIVDQYTNAVMTGDVAALEKLLAPNYWNIAGNGHIWDKEHFLQALRDKELVVNRLTITNARETKVGETRLITGNGEFSGKSLNPRPQGLMRYTMVVANNNGKEEVVLFQTTPVVPTKDCEDGNCKIR